MHGIEFSHRALKWARLKCVFLGHEKWSNLDGAWFCMRCLQTHNIELRWIRQCFDPNPDQPILMHDFLAMVKVRSAQLAADASAEKAGKEKSSHQD